LIELFNKVGIEVGMKAGIEVGIKAGIEVGIKVGSEWQNALRIINFAGTLVRNLIRSREKVIYR
jgi:hypothetical protein